QAVSSLGDNGLLFPRLITATGIIITSLDDCEPVSEHVPAVHDLQTERDLVLTLQVALSVRVTETDQLNWKVTLDTPPNTGLEIAHNATNTRVSSFRSTRHSVPLRGSDPHK